MKHGFLGGRMRFGRGKLRHNLPICSLGGIDSLVTTNDSICVSSKANDGLSSTLSVYNHKNQQQRVYHVPVMQIWLDVLYFYSVCSRQLLLFHTQTGQELKSLVTLKSPVYCLAINDSWIACASPNGIALYDHEGVRLKRFDDFFLWWMDPSSQNKFEFYSMPDRREMEMVQVHKRQTYSQISWNVYGLGKRIILYFNNL